MTAAVVCVCAVALIAFAAVYWGFIFPLHFPPRPKAGQKRVACVGDSITYGYLVAGQPWNSYPKVLNKLLDSDWCVGNFGYTDRTAVCYGSHPYTKEKLYSQSLAFQPDYVILMLGTNDTKAALWDPDAYVRDMETLIEKYRNLESRPAVCLLLPPPMSPNKDRVRYDIRGEVIERELIPLCRELAAKHGLPCVDAHGAFDGRDELFADGVHPNRKGAAHLAETVLKQFFEKEGNEQPRE